jgi:hypothetical protein
MIAIQSRFFAMCFPMATPGAKNSGRITAYLEAIRRLSHELA